jgi:hypothetical protein
MINISPNPKKQQYYIKNDIVYKIQSVGAADNSCPTEIVGGVSSETNDLPYIEVYKSDDITQKSRFYLDVLIDVGDYYIDNGTGKKVFKRKTSADTCYERDTYYYSYYKQLCINQIAESIRSYYTLDYNYFNSNRSKLGVPLWMFKDSEYGIKSNETVSDLEQINFTEEFFNKYKELAVENCIIDESEKIIAKYSFNKRIKKIEWENIQ